MVVWGVIFLTLFIWRGKEVGKVHVILIWLHIVNCSLVIVGFNELWLNTVSFIRLKSFFFLWVNTVVLGISFDTVVLGVSFMARLNTVSFRLNAVSFGFNAVSLSSLRGFLWLNMVVGVSFVACLIGDKVNGLQDIH